MERLEADSIHIIREVVAETERPMMLYSVGKDSAVMLHLARAAARPPESRGQGEERSLRCATRDASPRAESIRCVLYFACADTTSQL